MGTSQAEQVQRRLDEALAGPHSTEQVRAACADYIRDIDRAQQKDSDRYAAVGLLRALGWLALGVAVAAPFVRFWVMRGCPVWVLGNLPICR